MLGYRSPVPLAKFQMAPMPSSHISSGSKKKEPRQACLSEAKASHSHKMWTEVSSSVPHFLHLGSLHSPMICKCLLNVLCPVTTLVCVLLKDNRRGPIAWSGPKINSRACLHVLQGPRHNARCFMQYICDCFFFYLSRKFKFNWNMTKIMGALQNTSIHLLYLAEFFVEWELF
jgi:hypothetical protein